MDGFSPGEQVKICFPGFASREASAKSDDNLTPQEQLAIRRIEAKIDGLDPGSDAAVMHPAFLRNRADRRESSVKGGDVALCPAKLYDAQLRMLPPNGRLLACDRKSVPMMRVPNAHFSGRRQCRR